MAQGGTAALSLGQGRFDGPQRVQRLDRGVGPDVLFATLVNVMRKCANRGVVGRVIPAADQGTIGCLPVEPVLLDNHLAVCDPVTFRELRR